MFGSVVYSIGLAYHDRVEVYGDNEIRWYEWRVFDNGRIVFDSSNEPGTSFGRQYSNPDVALRDALMFSTGLPDPYYRQ